MKTVLLLSLLSTACLTCVAAEEDLSPSALTIVVCDSTNKVLDAVVVPDDKLSRSVKFTLPAGEDEIRVFALGARQHKDLSQGYFVTGRPDDEKWMGLGYVEAHVDKGILIAIDGNGFGPLKIDEALAKQIREDIKANTPAAITAVDATD